jgi:hypothetical protein
VPTEQKPIDEVIREMAAAFARMHGVNVHAVKIVQTKRLGQHVELTFKVDLPRG